MRNSFTFSNNVHKLDKEALLVIYLPHDNRPKISVTAVPENPDPLYQIWRRKVFFTVAGSTLYSMLIAVLWSGGGGDDGVALINPKLDTSISVLWTPSRLYYPPWILKRAGLKSSGRIASS